MLQSDITGTFGAIVWLEVKESCRSVSRVTCAVEAAHRVITLAPVPADVGGVLALVVICQGEGKKTG